MVALRVVETDPSGLVGLGVRVLLLSGDPDEAARLTQQLAGLGGRVDHEPEMYAALSALIDDPAGWDVFVVACDSLGGIAAGRRAHQMLGSVAERVATILVAGECTEQSFPDDRATPILLRARMSAAALRLALEHALRGRLAWRFG